MPRPRLPSPDPQNPQCSASLAKPSSDSGLLPFLHRRELQLQLQLSACSDGPRLPRRRRRTTRSRSLTSSALAGCPQNPLSPPPRPCSSRAGRGPIPSSMSSGTEVCPRPKSRTSSGDTPGCSSRALATCPQSSSSCALGAFRVKNWSSSWSRFLGS